MNWAASEAVLGLSMGGVEWRTMTLAEGAEMDDLEGVRLEGDGFWRIWVF